MACSSSSAMEVDEKAYDSDSFDSFDASDLVPTKASVSFKKPLPMKVEQGNLKFRVHGKVDVMGYQKKILMTATNEMAYMCKAVIRSNKEYELISNEFRLLLAGRWEGEKNFWIKRGDQIASTSNHGIERLEFSNAQYVNSLLSSMRSFRAMMADPSSPTHFVIFGRICFIGDIYQNRRCKKDSCCGRSVERIGERRFRCSKCGIPMTRAYISRSFSLTFKMEGACVKAKIFSREVKKLLRMSRIKDVETTTEDQMKRRLMGYRYCVVLKPSINLGIAEYHIKAIYQLK